MKVENGSALHQHIFDLVESIPVGKVATYGQISKLVGGCSARMVGFALASLYYRQDQHVPWQRVINSQGKISLTGPDAALQRAMLEDEGIRFNDKGVVNLDEFGWKP